MDARLHITILGDVQGVFFRAGVVGEAERIGGITGWVRNNSDGSVEVLAEGERDALERLLKWCSHGPAGASVSDIEKEWLPFKGGFEDFRVRYG